LTILEEEDTKPKPTTLTFNSKQNIDDHVGNTDILTEDNGILSTDQPQSIHPDCPSFKCKANNNINNNNNNNDNNIKIMQKQSRLQLNWKHPNDGMLLSCKKEPKTAAEIGINREMIELTNCSTDEDPISDQQESEESQNHLSNGHVRNSSDSDQQQQQQHEYNGIKEYEKEKNHK